MVAALDGAKPLEVPLDAIQRLTDESGLTDGAAHRSRRVRVSFARELFHFFTQSVAESRPSVVARTRYDKS